MPLRGVDEGLELVEAGEVGLIGGGIGLGHVAGDGDLEVVDEGLDVVVVLVIVALAGVAERALAGGTFIGIVIGIGAADVEAVVGLFVVG